MQPNSNHKGQLEAASLAAVHSELKSFRKAWDGLDERLDSLLCNLDEAATNARASSTSSIPKLQQPLGASVAGPPHLPAGLKKGTPEPVNSGQCDPVSSVQMLISSDGSATVKIDGHPEFGLSSPNLAALLAALVADCGTRTNDDLVGWKNFDDLKVALAKSRGGSFTSHSIRELVRRLRRELKKHKFSRSLIRNQRKLGYRFLLRRGVAL